MIKKKLFYENYVPQASFVIGKNALHTRLIKEHAPQARFLTKS